MPTVMRGLVANVRRVRAPAFGIGYQFTVELDSLSDSGRFAVDPPIVAGDFQLYIDHHAGAPLLVLPVVAPAGSPLVAVVLTPLEMHWAARTIIAHDPDGIWADAEWDIPNPAGTAPEVGGDGSGLAHYFPIFRPRRR